MWFILGVKNTNWVENEFKQVSFGDKRINERFIDVAKDLSSYPVSSINKASKDWSATKAAYRLFDNDKVSPAKILKPHIENTVLRCQQYPFVLAIQDTSSFNYTKHRAKKGLGHIGKKETDESDGDKGFFIHPTLALAPNGLPLGLLDNIFYGRNNKIADDDKESVRWCYSVENIHELCYDKANIISVADRECDFNEYLLTCLNTDTNFIIRSKNNRIIEESSLKLHTYITKSPVKDSFDIEVQNKKSKLHKKDNKKIKNGPNARFINSKGNAKRIAHVKLQYEKVHVRLYSNNQPRETLELSVVRVFEDRSELLENESPIEWILLTSLDIESNDVAKMIVDFYNKRWSIEIFFKTLKSGCKVEDCRLESYERITRYIALLATIAWRIYFMTFISRIDPDTKCTLVLSDAEWKSLYTKIHETKELPKTIPTVKDVTIWIAMLGGFLNRKNDWPPGNTVLWRGWERLTDITNMWEIFN